MVENSKKRLGSAIVYTGRLLINDLNNHFLNQKINITFKQLEILLHIVGNPQKKIIQQDLSILINKNKSGILRIIDILEKKRFVKRVPVMGDRRKNIIEATKEGVEVAEISLGIIKKSENKYMKKIAPKDEVIFCKVLDMIRSECSANTFLVNE